MRQTIPWNAIASVESDRVGWRGFRECPREKPKKKEKKRKEKKQNEIRRNRRDRARRRRPTERVRKEKGTPVVDGSSDFGVGPVPERLAALCRGWVVVVQPETNWT